MNSSLKISTEGLKFLSKWEGCILRPYMDVAKLWTIGVGHLIKPSDSFSTITNEQVKSLLASKDKNHPVSKIAIPESEALEILRLDVEDCENAIKRNIKIPLNQNQFDALVSFGFNCGTGVYGNSGVARALAAGNFEEVPVRLLDWDKATINGVKQPVLRNRRLSEGQLFSRPVLQQTSADIVVLDKVMLTEAQTALKKLGLYTLKVDGLWGPGSIKAFKDFGTRVNVGVDDPKLGVSRKIIEELKKVQ